jgi:hypothetical protein
MKRMFDVVVHSVLYHAGFSCDGQAFHAERFIVQVSNAAGRRWRHSTADFLGCIVHQDEDGITHFEDVRIPARESAEQVAELTRSTLAAGRKLIAADWEEDEPIYGSAEFERRRRLRLEFEV